MRHIAISALVVTTMLITGCLKKELTPEEKAMVSELRQQLESTKLEMEAAKAEDAALSGGLVKALISVRLEILKTNDELIQQRINAIEAGAPIKTTVNVYVPDPEAATKLSAEIEAAKSDLATAKAEANLYGGLVGALKAATVATKEQSLAMLEQRFLSAKYGLAIPGNAMPKPAEPVATDPSDSQTIGKDEFAACAQTPIEKERLACFGALATRHGVVPETPELKTEGAWITSSKQDPLTDATVSSAMLFAKNSSGRLNETPALVVM